MDVKDTKTKIKTKMSVSTRTPGGAAPQAPAKGPPKPDLSWFCCICCARRPLPHASFSFLLTTCSHIVCSSCWKRRGNGECPKCGVKANTLNLSTTSKLPKQLEPYYKNPIDLIKQLLAVCEFQEQQKRQRLETRRVAWVLINRQRAQEDYEREYAECKQLMTTLNERKREVQILADGLRKRGIDPRKVISGGANAGSAGADGSASVQPSPRFSAPPTPFMQTPLAGHLPSTSTPAFPGGNSPSVEFVEPKKLPHTMRGSVTSKAVRRSPNVPPTPILTPRFAGDSLNRGNILPAKRQRVTTPVFTPVASHSQQHTMSQQQMRMQSARPVMQPGQPMIQTGRPVIQPGQQSVQSRGQPVLQFGQPMVQSGQPRGQFTPPVLQFARPVMQSTQHMGQSSRPMGQSAQHMGQSGRPMGQSAQHMGQSGRPMGQSAQHMGQSGQHMGQSGQHMGQSAQHMGKSGQPMGQSAQHMGQSGRPMGQSAQHMGQSGQHMGQSAQHMGQSGQPMGQSAQHMGQSGRPMGQSAQHMGQSGRPMGQSAQHMGQSGGPMMQYRQSTRQASEPMEHSGQQAGQPRRQSSQPVTPSGQSTRCAGQPIRQSGQPVRQSGQQQPAGHTDSFRIRAVPPSSSRQRIFPSPHSAQTMQPGRTISPANRHQLPGPSSTAAFPRAPPSGRITLKPSASTRAPRSASSHTLQPSPLRLPSTKPSPLLRAYSTTSHTLSPRQPVHTPPGMRLSAGGRGTGSGPRLTPMKS